MRPSRAEERNSPRWLKVSLPDLLLLLSGRRDALRDALNAPPVEAEALGGLVVLALRLLAAHGFHVCVCVQPDRFTARVLNALPCPSSQPLVGSFRPVLARPSLMLARVGFVANLLRRIFAAFVAEGRPRSTWSDLALWSHVLPAAFPFSPAECSLAVAQALAESQRDWPLPEDWGLHSWEDPWASADPRTSFLDAFASFPAALDYAMYSDGSASGSSQCPPTTGNPAQW